jgi:hypothetical protein
MTKETHRQNPWARGLPLATCHPGNDDSNAHYDEFHDGEVASHASSVLYLRDCTAWTVRIAPERRPARWLVVNLIFAAVSLAVLLDSFLSMHDALARRVAGQVFLIYDVTTTAVWCLEVSLALLDRRVSGKTLCWWPLWIEICLALVFFWTSIQWLMAWQVQDVPMVSNLLDAALNTVAYLYVAYKCWRLTREERHLVDDLSTIPSHATPDEPTTHKPTSSRSTTAASGAAAVLTTPYVSIPDPPRSAATATTTTHPPPQHPHNNPAGHNVSISSISTLSIPREVEKAA